MSRLCHVFHVQHVQDQTLRLTGHRERSRPSFAQLRIQLSRRHDNCYTPRKGCVTSSPKELLEKCASEDQQS